MAIDSSYSLGGINPFFGIQRNSKHIHSCTNPNCNAKLSKNLIRSGNGFCVQCSYPVCNFEQFYNPSFGVPDKIKTKRMTHKATYQCPAEQIDKKLLSILKVRYEHS